MDYYEKLMQLSTQKICCPFCGCHIPNNDDTHKLHIVSIMYHLTGDSKPIRDITCETFNVNSTNFRIGNELTANSIIIEYIICPDCKEIATIVNNPYNDVSIPVIPKSSGKKYPEYIPEQIRQDYEEACLIADLSPKASATLSRRCIQGMIRHCWNIKKSRLVDEIDEVAQKSGMPQNQRDALDALRNIGNIGAHPEKDVNIIVDVEPNEAKLMLSLIEYFMQQWYIQKHDEEELMNKIIDIAQQKKNIKNHPQEQN